LAVPGLRGDAPFEDDGDDDDDKETLLDDALDDRCLEDNTSVGNVGPVPLSPDLGAAKERQVAGRMVPTLARFDRSAGQPADPDPTLRRPPELQVTC
jgi:hypothetical protein